MPKAHDKEVIFRFHRPNASEVFLAGDFNGWNMATMPMSREPNGDWSCRLRLREGIYRFRYYADGGWCTDYTECVAYLIEHAPFGCNSIQVVSDVELRGHPL